MEKIEERDYKFLFFSMAGIFLLVTLLTIPQFYPILVSNNNSSVLALISISTLWAVGLLSLIFLVVGFLKVKIKKGAITKKFFNSWRFSAVGLFGLGIVGLTWQLINYYFNR